MSRADNDFSQAELHQLRFKENKIERFLNSQGRATYGRPQSGGGGGSSGGGGTDTSNYLSSIGIDGVGAASETMPTNPPAGYVPNGNKTVKNHTANEAIRKMSLGTKSPGGNYYWTLKYKSNDDQTTPSLENPQWKLYQNSLIPPASSLTKPVSKYYWRTSQFEWLPMPGTIPGIKSRNWNGKTIHKLRG